MANRASIWNLAASLVAFLFFMLLLLAVIGGGVGVPEMIIWLVLGVAGVWLIVQRYHAANRTD